MDMRTFVNGQVVISVVVDLELIIDNGVEFKAELFWEAGWSEDLSITCQAVSV